MKGGVQSGFTIVETLLVLATTMLLLLSAYALIGGKQGQTEFDQAINETQSQLQQVIANVNNGYFPNLANINCQASATSSPHLTSSGPHQKGNNVNCIFLGTALHFYNIAPVNNPLNSTYSAYTVAARQCQSQSQVNIGTIDTCLPVDTVANSLPVLMAPGTTLGDPPIGTDLGLTSASIVNNQLLNGVTTNTVYINGSRANAIGTFAILSNPSAAYTGGVSTNFASGQQQLALYAVTPSTLNDDSPHAVDKFDTNNLTLVQQVQICLTSGTTQGSALITLGGTAGQLSVSLLRKDSLNCT